MPAFALLVMITACKTKKITGDNTRTTGPSKEIQTAEELLLQIDSIQPAFRNLNIKFSADIKLGKDENSVRGKLKIAKDSCVWASMLPFGIEAARILATNQDAGLINYLKRNYFQGDYSILSSQVGYTVTYSMLESALTGAAIFLEPKESYQLDKAKNKYYFSPYPENQFEKIVDGKELSNKNSIQALWFSDTDFTLVKNAMYDAPQRRYLEINYSNYQPVGRNLIPFLIEIHLITPKETGVFRIEYQKVDENINEMEYPFTIPASYEKLELK